MNVVGHQELVFRIEAEKPKVALFLGPSSVGKHTVAEYLRMAWRVDEGDTLRIDILNIHAARAIVHFASTAATHDRKLVIVRLDRAAHSALHVLLKTLEEAHESTDFILISEEPPLSTIASRSSIYRFGFLSDEQVAEVLVARNFRPDLAADLATKAGGQVDRALSIINNGDVKHEVMMVVRAFRESEPELLEAAAKDWTDQHTSLLAQWCQESLTGRNRIFSEEETIPTRPVPFRVLQALVPNVRPKLIVRANLMAALRGA